MMSGLLEQTSLPSPARNKTVRIGLLGMYASANLGDTAIQSAVIECLRSRRPDIEFVGISHDADDVVRTFGIPGFAASGHGPLVVPSCDSTRACDAGAAAAATSESPALLRRLAALRNIELQVRGLDMLLVSGGGQIDDFWGGPWRQPFRLFYWCSCARLRRKPIAVFSVGVDGLRKPLSEWFALRALEMAGYRSFRDTGSLEVLRRTGLRAPASVCPDPAFAYCPPAADDAAKDDRRGPKFVVISPISNHAFSGITDAEYESYLGMLATVGDQLTNQGIELRFVCSQTRMDPPVVARVTTRMKTRAGVSMVEVATPADFVAAVKGSRLVVASRLHALILSLVAGAPVIAVSPARKVRQQMKDVGLEDYCVELGGRSAAALLSKVQAALAGSDELRELIGLRVGSFRVKLAEAFDQLAALIPPGRD